MKNKDISEFQGERYASLPVDLHSNERLKKIFLEINKEKKGKILDLGCLRGEFSLELKRKGWNVFGADVSSALLEAKKKGIKCIKFDCEKTFPLKENFFDGVFAGEIIEHVFDTDFFISELHRILKPNGFLLISTPNTACLANRILLLFGKKPFNLDYSKGGGHIRAYTFSILESQLKRHGFKIERRFSELLRLSDKIEFPLLYKLESFLAEIFPTLSLSVIIKARKMQ
jgi:2-polyprenyl-3-methyl-5-hydroxy-6-metoxy-1,4-benzoquinol methylase